MERATIINSEVGKGKVSGMSVFQHMRNCGERRRKKKKKKEKETLCRLLWSHAVAVQERVTIINSNTRIT